MSDVKNLIQPKQPIFKVIPLAFNDSMSYYEQLCRLTAKINELINLFNGELTEELTQYIDERFNEIMINAMYDAEHETLILYLQNNS